MYQRNLEIILKYSRLYIKVQVTNILQTVKLKVLYHYNIYKKNILYLVNMCCLKLVRIQTKLPVPQCIHNSSVFTSRRVITDCLLNCNQKCIETIINLYSNCQSLEV